MSKQTAVEWLVEQLEKHHVKIDIKNTVVFQQAKEMEKQQMKESVLAQATKNKGLRKIFENQFEQYYTSTYGQ